MICLRMRLRGSGMVLRGVNDTVIYFDRVANDREGEEIV